MTHGARRAVSLRGGMLNVLHNSQKNRNLKRSGAPIILVTSRLVTTASSASTARDTWARWGLGDVRKSRAAAQRATATWHASEAPGGHGGSCHAQAAHPNLKRQVVIMTNASRCQASQSPGEET